MAKNEFVNDGFTFGIVEYLNNKEQTDGVKFNSFFAVVIRSLMQIYDELDILNPFYFNDEKTLDNNLKKYGYEDDNLLAFKNALHAFYVKESEEGFIFIERCLVDMFVKKNLSMRLTDEDKAKFRSLLYSPYAISPLMVSYNFMMSKNPTLIVDYFDKEVSENYRHEVVKPKETLNIEAYEILKYSLDDINNMSADELEKVNKKVYNYFDINANAINKKYLLDKAVYDFNHPKPALSSGNGYVDILFILSLVATLAMIIMVITLVFL